METWWTSLIYIFWYCTVFWHLHCHLREVGEEKGENISAASSLAPRIGMFPVETPTGTQLGLGILPCCEVSNDLRFKMSNREVTIEWNRLSPYKCTKGNLEAAK